MPKLILTFAYLLKVARVARGAGLNKVERRIYLTGFLNGANGWELPK